MSDETVCHCMDVSHDDIVAAIRAGATSVEAITEATEAGNGCGGCLESIADILEAETK